MKILVIKATPVHSDIPVSTSRTIAFQLSGDNYFIIRQFSNTETRIRVCNDPYEVRCYKYGKDAFHYWDLVYTIDLNKKDKTWMTQKFEECCKWINRIFHKRQQHGKTHSS